MGIKSYFERKIDGHYKNKYEKFETIEEVQRELRKAEKGIKWGNRIVDGTVLCFSLYGIAANPSNRDLIGFAEGYASSVAGELAYEKITEDPKEKSVGRILSGISASISAGAAHAVIERAVTGVACELDILQKSSFGGVIETFFDTFTVEFIEKNREYANKRIEELETRK